LILHSVAIISAALSCGAAAHHASHLRHSSLEQRRLSVRITEICTHLAAKRPNGLTRFRQDAIHYRHLSLAFA
jgi:hypothetical protein